MKTLRVGAAVGAALALTLTACSGGGSTTGSSASGSASKAASSAASGSASKAASSAAAAPVSGTLQGTGASSMKSAQEVWRAEFQKKNSGATVNYSPDGSGAGRTAFKDGAADWAGSDRALKDEEITAGGAKCVSGTKPINLPVYISPIAIGYNLQGVDKLKLNGEVTAKIFAGQITTWSDPAIKALNDGVTLPDTPITPVHRSDNSGTTENFTETLSQVAPSVWTEKASGDWPKSITVGEAADKTSGVASAIQNGEGYIGYLDVSGLPQGVKTAEFNAKGDGEYVGPTAEAAAKIVNASKRVDGRGEHDYSLKLDRTAAGYPFVLVSYAIACEQYQDAKVGALVNAYLSYMVSDEGQKAAQPQAGNAPLAGELSTNVKKAAAAIK